MNNNVIDTAFSEGDEVVLAHGTYQGTSGIFLRLTSDINWAGIQERSGNVRNHPVAWLAHVAPSGASAPPPLANPGPQ